MEKIKMNNKEEYDCKQKPLFPPCRHETESFLWPIGFCKCGSSLKGVFSKKCIQPNCKNYYIGFPSEDTHYDNGVYELDGTLKFYPDFKK